MAEIGKVCRMVWHYQHGVVWYDVLWYGVVWYGVTSMALCCMMWYGMVS